MGDQHIIVKIVKKNKFIGMESATSLIEGIKITYDWYSKK